MILETVYIFLLIELVVVSYGDFKTKKIPNAWSILNIVILIIFFFMLPEFYKLHWKTFFFSTVFILVGFFLFLIKIMGGGDSKFLFSFYLLVPVSCQDHAFSYLLYSTIIIGTGIFLMVTLKNFQKLLTILEYGQFQRLKEIYGTKIPFAPIILFSWVWMGWEMNLAFFRHF